MGAFARSCVMLLVAVVTDLASCSCLDGAVPPEERLLLEADGHQVPFGIVELTWPSAQLVGRTVAVLVAEVLGYHVNFSAFGGGSDEGVVALMGCSLSPDGALACPAGPYPGSHPHHAAFEVWENTHAASKKTLAALAPQRVPEVIPLRYKGSENDLFPSRIFSSALEERGLHLDVYVDYDAKWKQPWTYYSKFTDIPEARLRPCSETRLGSKSMMQLFQEFTPDPGGVDERGLALCRSGVWWLSPACRYNITKCIPFLSGGAGWFSIPTMQRAVEYNIPLAVATAASWNDYVSLPMEFTVMMYAWAPSNHFIRLSPLPILFPLADKEAQDRGDMRTFVLESSVSIYTIPTLNNIAPFIHAMLSAFAINMNDLNWMFKDLDEHSDLDTSACRWLRNFTPKWQSWIPKATHCALGQGLVNTSGSFVVDRSNAVSCAPCRFGHASEKNVDVVGETHVCRACQAGTSQPMWGMRKCEPCGEGYFQDLPGQPECLRCAKGFVASGVGTTACTACPDGKTTDGTGFVKMTDCACSAGSFWLELAKQCAPCGRGLVCRGLGAAPEAEIGYQLLDITADGASVFQCHGDPKRCPGGPLGTCAAGRTGTSCAECEPAKVAASDGSCVDCRGADLATSAVIFFFGGLALVVLYVSNSQQQRTMISDRTMILLFMVAQFVSMGQLAGMLSRVAVAWPPPMDKIFDFVFSIFFRIEDRFRTSCLAPMPPMGTYVTKIFLFPMTALLLTIFHAVRCVLTKQRFCTRLPALVGSVGVLCLSLYISLTILIASPLQCRQHPNGKWTVAQYESITCWESGEHPTMLVLGCFALSIPIGFLAMVATLLAIFPRRARQGDAQFMHTYAFIFRRVRPDARWFMLFILVRNFIIALAPSIPNGFWQIFTLTSALLVSAILIARLLPWRTYLANVVDLISMATFLTLLQIAIVFAGDTVVALPEVAFTVFALFFSIFPFYLLWVFVRYITMRKTKPFHLFISHHKASAGAFARLLKLTLAETRPADRVFLDCDNLSDLQKLLGHVGSDTERMLLVCSPPVLRSHYCVAELTVAHVNSVPVTCILFEGFTFPTDKFVDKLEQEVPLTKLFEQAFSIDVARSALRDLKNKFAVELHSKFHEAAAEAILEQAGMTATQPSLSPGRLGGMAYGLKSFDSWQMPTVTGRAAGAGQPVNGNQRSSFVLAEASAEASAAAMVLIRLLRWHVAATDCGMPRFFDVEAVPPEFTKDGATLIPLFTQNCFMCVQFLAGLAFFADQGVHQCLPVVVGRGFEFPTGSTYVKVAHLISLHAAVLGDVDAATESFRQFLQAIFEKICARLEILGSLGTLKFQTGQITQCLADRGRVLLANVSPCADPGALGRLHRAFIDRGSCRQLLIDGTYHYDIMC